MPAITSRQIRGARGMLNWSMLDLAKVSGLSISTVKRAEDSAPEDASAAALDTIRAALEKAGVRFLTDGDGSVGVVLKAP